MTPVIKFLAQFLLLVKTSEYNTTNNCLLCHCETGFANTHEKRSKVCKNCAVNGGKDFFYDRDWGSASNIQYTAEFFVLSGGFYPAEHISVKEREKRQKLFRQFMQAVRDARREKKDAGGRNVNNVNGTNNASGVKAQ